MTCRRLFISGIAALLAFSCSGRTPLPEDPAPIYGTSAGSRVLGNGHMVMLFGKPSDRGTAPIFYNLFIRDYTRIIMNSFRLRIMDLEDTSEVLYSSHPWFGAHWEENREGIRLRASAYIPADKNALIISGYLYNNSRNSRRVLLHPEFTFNRPMIFDHHDRYSNIYVDEFTLSYGWKDWKNPSSVDGPAAVRDFNLGSGSGTDFTFILAIDPAAVQAGLLFESLSSGEDLEAETAESWESWLSEGMLPEFSDPRHEDLFKLNLASLKALNLNGAVPADISGQFVTDSLPQLYPRDAMMTARALLETGHVREVSQILNYWSARPMKQEGEWFARYDAFGTATDGGSGARYDVPEWDSNGYYASLIRRARQKEGLTVGSPDLQRSLLQFPEGRFHSNDLLYEGGIVEWPGYLPSTTMSLCAAYFQAAETASENSRYLEADSFRELGLRLDRGLFRLIDPGTSAYMDIRENKRTWNTTSLFGWIWGYPDHGDLQTSAEFYWQHCRKDGGGIQYFDAEGYGDDLFIFSTAALAQYYAFRGYIERYRILLDWMINRSSAFGMLPERVYYPLTPDLQASEASPLTWANAEFVMALQAGALCGILGDNKKLRDREIKVLSRSLFGDSLLQDSIAAELDQTEFSDPDDQHDLQKLRALLASDTAPDSRWNIRTAVYPASAMAGSVFNLPLILPEIGPAYPDSLFVDGPALEIMGFDKSTSTVTVGVAETDVHRDRFISERLHALFRTESDTFIVDLPLNLKVRAPWTLKTVSLYCEDSLRFHVVNRVDKPLVMKEMLTQDSAVFTLGGDRDSIFSVILPMDLPNGLFTLPLLAVSGTDTSSATLNYIRCTALDLSGIWYIDTEAGRNISRYRNRDPLDISLPGIDIPSAWEDQGYTGLDGDVQLLCPVFFPDDWRSGTLIFQAGAIDDEDNTYLNGKLIGSTQGWDSERLYRIDPAYVKWNDMNLLQILVSDMGNNGGIWKGPVRIIQY